MQVSLAVWSRAGGKARLARQARFDRGRQQENDDVQPKSCWVVGGMDDG